MEILPLRIPEVADRLAVSRAKVYELIARGQLRTVKIDGCGRVRTDDLVVRRGPWPGALMARLSDGVIKRGSTWAASSTGNGSMDPPGAAATAASASTPEPSLCSSTSVRSSR